MPLMALLRACKLRRIATVACSIQRSRLVAVEGITLCLAKNNIRPMASPRDRNDMYNIDDPFLTKNLPRRQYTKRQRIALSLGSRSSESSRKLLDVQPDTLDEGMGDEDESTVDLISRNCF